MTVRMRHTRAHTANRRSHHSLSEPSVAVDQDGTHLRHRVSPTTGKYKGAQVIDLSKKEAKLAAKKEAKAEAAKPAKETKKEAKAEKKTEEKK